MKIFFDDQDVKILYKRLQTSHINTTYTYDITSKTNFSPYFATPLWRKRRKQF